MMRRRARARGEGGGVAGVGDSRRGATPSTTAALERGTASSSMTAALERGTVSSSTAGVSDGRRRGAMESATAALVKFLTPESKVKMGAPVGTDMYVRAWPSSSTTAGVGDGDVLQIHVGGGGQ